MTSILIIRKHSHTHTYIYTPEYIFSQYIWDDGQLMKSDLEAEKNNS